MAKIAEQKEEEEATGALDPDDDELVRALVLVWDLRFNLRLKQYN